MITIHINIYEKWNIAVPLSILIRRPHSSYTSKFENYITNIPKKEVIKIKEYVMVYYVEADNLNRFSKSDMHFIQ